MSDDAERRRRDLQTAEERIAAAEAAHAAAAQEAALSGGEVDDDVARTDLRGLDLTGADFRGRDLRRVVFGDHERDGPPPARLAGALFRGAHLRRCRLADCDLDRPDFREARLVECDLRYAVVRSGTFQAARLTRCDLYRAAFEGGTVFENARLDDVSLNHTRLDGVVNLTPSALGPDDGEAGLLQEDAEAFGGFLRAGRWYRVLVAEEGRDAADAWVERAIAEGYDAAATVYRRLAGMWASQGEYRYASWAYVSARRRERDSMARSHDGTPSKPVEWALLGLADWLSGFGESPLRVLRAALLVVLVPALLYWAFGAVEVAGQVQRNAFDILLFSLGQVTTAAPERLEPATRLVELTGELQTLTGIVLLGLFGFVLGNKIRMS